jgi:hypothetical protein
MINAGSTVTETAVVLFLQSAFLYHDSVCISVVTAVHGRSESILSTARSAVCSRAMRRGELSQSLLFAVMAIDSTEK